MPKIAKRMSAVEVRRLRHGVVKGEAKGAAKKIEIKADS